MPSDSTRIGTVVPLSAEKPKRGEFVYMMMTTEQARFNALTQEEAAKLLARARTERNEGVRSCWYCNLAHEHLKSHYFTCHACGVTYLWGYPGPFLVKRSTGAPITEADMREFQGILETADEND